MKNLGVSLLLLLLIQGSFCLAQDTSREVKHPVRPEFSYADGWLGGDGTLSTRLPDGRILWIFSDSYVSRKSDASERKQANTIVSNTVAVSSLHDRQVEMKYFWRKKGRKQQAFFISPEKKFRFWPTWAFTRMDTVFVLMCKVGEKEDPDPDDIFNFTLSGNCLAVVTGTEHSDPLQWKIELVSYSEIIPGKSLNQAARDSNYLYVIKNSDPGNYLSNEIHYRYAGQITGPWSEAGVLYVTPEQSKDNPAYDPRHFCYLARAHSLFSDVPDRKLLITYDCNSTEFFHAAGSDFIYIPRVILVDVPKEIKP